MNYQTIKTIPNLYEVTTPTATKSKDWGNGKVSYIIKGTIAKLTNEELANLCGNYESIIKVYRNNPTHAVIILQTHRQKVTFYRNRFGGFDTSYIPGIGKMYIR
jgi:hypothetical protein